MAMSKSVAKNASLVVAVATAVILCAGFAYSDPIVFNFADDGADGEADPSPPVGERPAVLEYKDGDSVVLRVTGFHFDGTDWVETSLYRRRETNDNGLGVCSPGDRTANGGTDCPGPSGGGDWNELDNNGEAELILLELGDGYEWVSVGFSSLDMNGGSDPERGRLWFADSSDPSSLLGNPFFDFGASGTDVEPNFTDFPVGTRTSFLFFEPFDWGVVAPIAPPALGAGGSVSTTTTNDNDFLVRSAVITQQTAVPEPSSVLALGVGLAALGLRARRGRQRR